MERKGNSIRAFFSLKREKYEKRGDFLKRIFKKAPFFQELKDSMAWSENLGKNAEEGEKARTQEMRDLWQTTSQPLF